MQEVLQLDKSFKSKTVAEQVYLEIIYEPYFPSNVSVWQG
jgi:hypothetical protein